MVATIVIAAQGSLGCLLDSHAFWKFAAKCLLTFIRFIGSNLLFIVFLGFIAYFA